MGPAVTAEVRGALTRQLLEDTERVHITYLHLEFIGSRKLCLVGAVDLAGNRPESEVATNLRTVERQAEKHDGIEDVIMTPSTADEPSLNF